MENSFKLFSAVFLLICFWVNTGNSQKTNYIKPTSQVGCIQHDDDGKRIGFEEITEGDCIIMCSDSTPTFYIIENELNIVNISWNVNYGNIIEEIVDPTGGGKIVVEWDIFIGIATPSVTATIDFGDGTSITESICVQLKKSPQADFEILGNNSVGICSGTDILFQNTSTYEDEQIISYLWDFGDESYSYEHSPIHHYSETGIYMVSLTIIDECGCKSLFTKKINVNESNESINIDCPTVVCENDVEIYSIEQDYFNCNTDQLWDVDGGTIEQVNNDSSISVLWNNVDESGFGYLYFDHSLCDDECSQQSVYKIPVVQQNGTIVGPSYVCDDEQVRYSLPKWPTTDFKWQLFYQGENLVDDALILIDQRNEVVLDADGLSDGVYILKAAYTNTLLQCTGQAEIEIEVRSRLMINDSQTTFCLGDEITFENLNYDYYSSWSLIKNNEIIEYLEDIVFTHTFTETGVYNLSSGASGYCVSAPMLVEILAPADAPEGDLMGDMEVCVGQPHSYTFSNTEIGDQLVWNVSNGVFNGGNTGETVSIIFEEDGPYQVEVRYQEPGTDCLSDPVMINPTQISFTDEILHENDEIEFCGSSMQNFSAAIDDAEVYTWTIEPENLGSIASGQGTKDVEVSFFNAGSGQNTGQLKLELRKCGIMHEQEAYDFSIVSDPQISINIGDTICALDPVDIEIYSDPPLELATTGDINLHIGNGQVLTEPTQGANPNLLIFEDVEFSNVSEDISRVLQVTVENPNGCNSPLQQTKSITIAPAPVFELIHPSSSFFCESQAGSVSFDFEVSIQGSTSMIKWKKDGNFLPNTNDVNYTATEAGVYQVEITNINGCKRTSFPFVISMMDCEGENGSGGNGGTTGCNYQIEPPDISLVWSECNTIEASSTYDTNAGVSFEGGNWNVSSPISNNEVDIVNQNNDIAEINFNGIGQFNVDFTAQYEASCNRKTIESIFIGYQPRLFYTGNCNFGNGTYTLTLFNESPYFESYKPDDTVIYQVTDLSTNVTTTLDLSSPNANFDSADFDLVPGEYELSLSVGKNGYPTCSTTEIIELLPLPDAQFDAIAIENCDPTENCSYCQDSGILFTPVNPVEGHQYEWEIETSSVSFFNSQDLTISENAGLVNITLKVTDQFGCENFSFTTIDIADNLVQGSIIVDNLSCDGEPFNPIEFETDNNIQNIQWMLESNEILGANNLEFTPQIEGSYWVKASTDDGCIFYSDANFVSSIQPPNIGLTFPEYACKNQAFSLFANLPLNTEYRILRNGEEEISWTDEFPVQYQFTEESVGNFEYSLEIVDVISGCVNSKTEEIEIIDAPEIELTYELMNCDPYELKLVLNTTQSLADIEWINWSNGQHSATGFDNEILIDKGGAYKAWVKFTNSECLAEVNVFVPKHPDEFIWIFPEGCLAFCRDKLMNSYVIGPMPSFTNYEWNDDQSSGFSGQNSAVEDYFLNNTVGSLNLGIQNINCAIESKGLHITYDYCEDCQDFSSIHIVDVNLMEAPYLHYQIEVDINADPNLGSTFSFYDDEFNGVFFPNTTYLPPGTGSTSIVLDYIPDLTIGNNHVNIYIEGEAFGDLFCSDLIHVSLANASGRPSNELKVHINPMNHFTEVSYKLNEMAQTNEIEIFNIQGKSVYHSTINEIESLLRINVDWVAGAYILVLKQNGNITDQRIIIKK